MDNLPTQTIKTDLTHDNEIKEGETSSVQTDTGKGVLLGLEVLSIT